MLASIAATAGENGSLTLGSGNTIPGREVQVPIYLNLPANEQLDQVTAFVNFPRVFKFTRAEETKEARAGGVVVSIKDSASPAGSKLQRVELTVQSAKGKPLPNGVVGLMTFAVDKKATQQMASLPVADVKGIQKGGSSPVALRGDPGSIIVYESEDELKPGVSCFFFSH